MCRFLIKIETKLYPIEAPQIMFYSKPIWIETNVVLEANHRKITHINYTVLTLNLYSFNACNCWQFVKLKDTHWVYMFLYIQVVGGGDSLCWVSMLNWSYKYTFWCLLYQYFVLHWVYENTCILTNEPFC